MILLGLHKVRNQSNRLDRLSETHFVGQDSVQVVIVQRDQPFQSLDLVF